MRRRLPALALGALVLVVALGAVGAAAPGAIAEVLAQASSIKRSFYPMHIESNHTAAILDVDQAGTGSILNLSDGGVDEYTFDQSSATFTNQLNLTGALNLDGAIDLDGVITNADGLEHIGLETYATAGITFTAAAGGTVPLFTIGAGEEWLVRLLLLEVTTNFDATGDDVTLTIGDGNDVDGFCVLADAELQAADTEGTGWSAGWQCQAAATQGVYIDGRGGFLYDEASSETIDAIVDETSGETITAGAATAHIWYTRLP